MSDSSTRKGLAARTTGRPGLWVLACVTLTWAGWTAAAEPAATVPVRLEWIVRGVAAQGQADRVDIRSDTGAQVPAPGQPVELVHASAGVLAIQRVAIDGSATRTLHPLPAFNGRYPEVMVHPGSGAIQMHGQARSVLQVVEWRRDASLVERLYLSHPEISALYQRSVNQSAQLLGDARDGYWLLDRRNGAVLHIQPGDTPEQADVTKLPTAPDCCSSAAIGADRTLWLIGAQGVVQRIDRKGVVLARAQLSFDPRGDQAFGERLFPAASGVVVVSSDRMQLVRLDDQAQVRSRHALCDTRPQAAPAGTQTLSCGQVARRAGRLRAFAHATGLADGSVLAGDGERMASLSPDGAMRLLGGSTPCDIDLEALRGRPAGTAFRPCHDASFRATALQRADAGAPVGTWLLASPDDGLRHRYLLSWPGPGHHGMRLSLAPDPEGWLKGLSGPSRELRARLADTFVDLRHGARPPNGWDERAVGRFIGNDLHTRAGLSEGADHLDAREGQPGAVLKFLSSDTSDFAVLEAATILVYTWSRGDSAFWRYDVVSRRFDGQRVRLRPQPAACGAAMQERPEPFASQLTNAWGGETLLLDGGRRQIGQITPDLRLSLIGCLPAPPETEVPGVASRGRSVWRLAAAARDREGRWWLGMRDGSVLVQAGDTFVRAELRSVDAGDGGPERQGQRLSDLSQLLPGPDGGMLVIGPAGIARLDRVAGTP